MRLLSRASVTHAVAVTSSCNIATIPLAEAQAMFPPPRPPSPESRNRAQRARLADANPNSLTPKDAAVLMSLQKPVAPNLTVVPPKSKRRISSALSVNSNNNAEFVDAPEPPGLAPSLSPTTGSGLGRPRRASQRSGQFSPKTDEEADLLNYVNRHLPRGVPEASNFTTSFKSGRIILRLAEQLSGQSKNIPDSKFGVGQHGQGTLPEGDDDAHVRARD